MIVKNEDMTFNDFFNISTFIGDRIFCYAILRQPIGKDNFDTLVKILPPQKRFLVNADAKGQNKDKYFYFVTAINEKTHRANCVLVYEEDCPFPPKTKGVFKVTKKYVLDKMKRKNVVKLLALVLAMVMTMAPAVVRAR